MWHNEPHRQKKTLAYKHAKVSLIDSGKIDDDTRPKGQAVDIVQASRAQLLPL
ncbi:MAG: hypothetical protein J5846_03975 [Desulfovibrio sp.]|nr:hypothetical protein [Desulfovibrio sp.]